MSDLDEMLYREMEQAIVDFRSLDPGSPEYKTQAEVIKIYEDMIRERERYADEIDEKSRKKTFRDWVNEINWLEVGVKYLLPAAISVYEVRAIMRNEAEGNFITTKAFSLLQKPLDLFKRS